MKSALLKTFSTNFSKGLSFAASHMISPEECQSSNNFLFSDGEATVRNGTALYGVVSSPIVALQKHYDRDGDAYFVVVAGGLPYISRTSGVFTSVSTEALSGNVYINAYDDFVYFANYPGTVKYFDGSSMAIAGISSPILTVDVFDFTTTDGWLNRTSCQISLDTNYAHIGKGTTALKTSEISGSAVIAIYRTEPQDLSKLNNISSTQSDLFQIMTTHGTKSNISSVKITFYNNTSGLPVAQADVHSTSSWVGCSNDGATLIHTIPKRLFLKTSGFDWSNCFIDLEWVSVSTATSPNPGNNYITFSDFKLIKCPPVVNRSGIKSTNSILFFGSSVNNTERFKMMNLNTDLQGVLANEAIPDGKVFYKCTYTKQGPNGLIIESNPCMQSSGLSLSTVISSYLVNNSGITVSTQIVYAVYTAAGGVNPEYWIDSSGVKIAAPPSNSYYTASISGNIEAAYVRRSGTNISTVFLRNQIILNDIPLAPAEYGCFSRNLYRRQAIDSVFRYVYTIADNETTSFVDNVPTGALGQALETELDPPPIAKYIYSASNQKTYYLNINEAGTAYPSRVRHSLVYQPYYVPLNNVFDVSPGDGTHITGMFEFSGYQWITKERSLWMLDSTGALSLAYKTYGCVAPNSIAVAVHAVYWLSGEGIIEFNMRMNNISIGNNKTINLINSLPKQYLSQAAGVYFKGYYLLALTSGGKTSNDMVLCYDTNNGTWSTFLDINVNCWSTWGGSTDGERLFYGNDAGQVCEFFVGNTDLGNPIPWSIRTKDFGVASPQESYREVFLFSKDIDGQNRKIKVSPYYDMNNSTADNDYIDTADYTSGVGLGKISLPPKDGASYVSFEFSSSGRISIVSADAYSKEESIR